MLQELLPELVRVLGPDHPQILEARGNIAYWTGQHGDSAEALRMLQELLPELVRVLGPDHPDTLTARGNIAFWTAQRGNSAEALRMLQELLPDQVRAQGPDHPHTLGTRGNIAELVGKCGDSAEALRMYQELLPDLVRVLGPDHPQTLTARDNIAYWTAQRGNSAEALRMYQELLPPGAGPGPRPPRHPGHSMGHRTAGWRRLMHVRCSLLGERDKLGRRLWLAGGSGWPCLVCRAGVHPNPMSASAPGSRLSRVWFAFIDNRPPLDPQFPGAPSADPAGQGRRATEAAEVVLLARQPLPCPANRR